MSSADTTWSRWPIVTIHAVELEPATARPFVIPAGQQSRHHARLAAADRFWGCPTRTVATLDEAHQWALSQLADPAPTR